MLATETEEQRQIRLIEEKEVEKRIQKTIKESREFELKKLRLESSVPHRWKAILNIFNCIFVYPITIICITILLLCKRDIKVLTRLFPE